MRYVEGIFTSVCTSLCVRSFSAILGLQNRLVNKEIELYMGLHFGDFELLGTDSSLPETRKGMGFCLCLMYIRLSVCCEACSSAQWPFHVVFF